MPLAVGVCVGLSPQFNPFCFFLCLTSHGLKQLIGKNYLPGKQLEEHKQWCDYRQIFFDLCFVLVVTLRACVSRYALVYPTLCSCTCITLPSLLHQSACSAGYIQQAYNVTETLPFFMSCSFKVWSLWI